MGRGAEMPERKREVETPIAPGGAVEAERAASPAVPAVRPSESSILREMVTIAAPSVVTMTSYTVMQFIDKLMVKEVGPDPVYISAQGNAGITAWLFMTFAIGTTSIVNSFVSQNLGAGTPRKGSAYAWNALWIGLAYWAAVMLPSVMLVGLVFRAYGHDGHLYELEMQYATISLAGSIFTLTSRGLHHYFYGLHRPGTVMVAAISGNLVNVFANWVFIFGHLGVPAMGVAGAAVGTVIGTAIELAIPLFVFLSPVYERLFGTRSAWRPGWALVKDLFRVGWPAGMTWLNELICWQYLMANLVGRGGHARALALGATQEGAERASTVANTAGFIALQYMHLSFMPAIGISIATQAMVGKSIGAGDPEGAARRTMLGLKLTMGYMGACALAFVALRGPMIRLFVESETPPEIAGELVRVGGAVMICAAVFQVFDALAITLSAALRGAGDTVWPGVATIVTSWLLIVGGGHLAIEVAPRLGSIGPWIGASGYIVVLSLLYAVRWRGGKWRTMKLTHDDTLHHLPPDEVAPGTSPGAS